MIQNYLVFCVKSDLTFVEGSLPSGKLVANDVNRNSIFVIAPHIGTIITANFITTTQGDLPRTTFGTYVGDKMSVEDLVDKSESYYNLVKDWNIFEFKLPSTTLSFIARNRTGQIGISFSFDEYVIPAIKPIYGDFLGTITSTVGLTNDVGYYVIGGVGLEIYDPKTDENIELGYNDILVSTIEPAFYKINAYHYKGSTGTVKYTVDPSILNDNFETIEPSLTTQIVGKVNDNSNNIALIFTAITTNVNDISGLTARVSTNESDIADLELNVVKTITKTNTHSIETIINRTNNNVNIGSNVRIDVANNGLLKVGINGLSVSNNDVALSVKNSVIADTQGLATKINEPLEAHKISGSAHSDIRSDLATRELASNKGVASGYAPLDNNTKLPLIYLYDSVLGQLEYAGTFNPNDGYPTMTNALSLNRGVRKGDYFISIGNAVIDTVDYKVGDWAIRSGDGTWAKINNTDAVASVNGKLGVVVLDGLDIVVGGGDNTTLRAKIVSIDQALADIYRKSETYTQLETNNKIALELLNYYTKATTYSKAEVDALLNQLKAVYGWEDSSLADLTFLVDGLQNVSASTFDGYDFILVTASFDNEKRTLFLRKEDFINDGTSYNIQFDRECEINIWRAGSNISVDVDLTGFDTFINFTGLKMSPLTSAKMTHNGEVLEDVLDTLQVDINSVENVASANTFNIKAIEELARKSASGETSDNVLGTDIIPLSKDTANAPMSVEVDGGVLEAPNLVLNGEIEKSYYGYANYVQLLSLEENDVLYANLDIKIIATTYGGANGLVRIGKTSSLNLIPTSDLFLDGLYHNRSGIGSYGATETAEIYVYGSSVLPSTTYVKNFYLYNVSQMKLKGVKNDDGVPFALLTNTQIKTQLDLWVSKGILPNDNLLSVNMNKKITSVGKNLLPNNWEQGVVNIDGSLNPTMVRLRSVNYIPVKPATTYVTSAVSPYVLSWRGYDVNKNIVASYSGTPFTTASNVYYIKANIIKNDIDVITRDMINVIKPQLELGTTATTYEPYVNSDLYLQANTKGYSLPNGVKDTIEYRNGKYYFVKRVDDTDLNNLVELSPYVETEIEAWGNLQGYESGIVYVDDIKIDASIYASSITTTSEIKALDEIVKITNGVETQIDTSLAVIAVDKLSFTHPDLVDGDYVWFAYEEDGNYYKATTNITYYIDKLVRTSPDGSVWKLDWSVDNSGVVTWTPTKI